MVLRGNIMGCDEHTAQVGGNLLDPLDRLVGPDPPQQVLRQDPSSLRANQKVGMDGVEAHIFHHGPDGADGIQRLDPG